MKSQRDMNSPKSCRTSGELSRESLAVFPRWRLVYTCLVRRRTK